MRKRYASILIILIHTVIIYSAEIKGTVFDQVTGSPLGYANLAIKGTDTGTAANDHGQFTLTRLEPGLYTLHISHIGYEPVSMKINVNDKIVQQDVYLRQSIFKTEKVVVTATRHETLLQNVPVVTEIVNRDEILERGVDHVAGALEDRAGIMIVGSASGGKNISINGIDGKHVLVLDDGLPIAGKVNNRLDLSQLDVDEIEHIEIVKGPGSALYGTEAMGGVVNIISRDVIAGFQVNADAKYGSGDQYNGHLGVSGGSGQLAYIVGMDYNTGGYEKNEVAFDINDILNSGMYTKLRYTTPSVGKFTLKAGYRQDELGYSSNDVYGIFTDYNSDANRTNTSLSWDHQLNNADIRLQGFVSDYEKELTSEIRNKEVLQYIPFPLPAYTSELTRERLAGFKSDVHWSFTNRFGFDAGYDFLTNHYESNRVNGTQERDQHGIYAQFRIAPVARWMIMAGGRFDAVTGTDGFFSPRLSSKFDLTHDLLLRMTWGQGFRLPSFTDLYVDYTLPYAGGLVIQGNPELEHEHSTGSNIGLEYLWNHKVMVSVMGFRNEFENLINQYNVAPRVYTYRNVESAVYTGAEFQTRFYLFQNLSTTLSYNYTDVDQALGNYTVTNIAPHTASARLVYRVYKDKLSLTLRDQFWGNHKVQIYDEQRGQFLETLQTKSKYHILDISAQFRLNAMLSLRAGMNNINNHQDELYGPFVGRQSYLSFHIVR